MNLMNVMNGMRITVLLMLMAALSVAAGQEPRSPQALCDAAQPAAPAQMQFQAAEAVLESGLDYRAIFCTSAGAIYVDLYENLTPLTVNNFVFLAQQGYYDSTTFHRVIPDFMAQGGDPTATGSGGPGYRFDDEPVGFLVFARPGLLAMANAGPGTNGSQFFITTAPTPHLNYRHTIFGEVLLGQEQVIAIRERDPQTAADPGEALHTVIIISDPAQVDDSAAVKLPPPTQAEVAAAFEGFAADLPPSLSLDESSGAYTTEQLQARLPADLQADFAGFAAAYGHQYGYEARILNAECDAEIFFSQLAYRIDAFDSRADAEAAQHDSFTADWMASRDSAPLDAPESPASLFIREAGTCAGAPGYLVSGLYTRGEYLVRLEVLTDAAVLEQVDAADLVDSLANQLEGAFASIYMRAIR